MFWNEVVYIVMPAFYSSFGSPPEFWIKSERPHRMSIETENDPANKPIFGADSEIQLLSSLIQLF